MQLVSKQLRWEAAHRLTGNYPGNCRFVHGHSYVAIIEILLRPDSTLDQFGFVRDFHDFKPLKQWVDDNWDHATLVAHLDSPFLDFLLKEEQKHFVFEGNPTAENIARCLFEQAENLLNDERVCVYEVRINETCTSEAKYQLEV